MQHFFRILLLAFPGIILPIFAQTPFRFEQKQDVEVFYYPDKPALRNAWAGGLNSPQFSELDIDGDLIEDILVFDRSTNQVLPFIREDSGYKYRHEYTTLFPDEMHWMLARDYNGDGLMDLFCSAGQGIRVYQNIANPGTVPEFEQRTPLIYADYGNGLLNLFVNQVDIPSIEDIDGDGDLDILSFYILGTCVEYHKNISMERFGHRDSLVYQLHSDNWGLFTEDALSNSVNLNDSCDRVGGGLRHSGSTLLADDPDQDGDKDLFLGDISYPELLFLMNAPEAGRDIIKPMPEHYPENYRKFRQELFPAAYRLRNAGNGLPGLILAPNTDEQSICSDSVSKIYRSSPGSFLYTLPPKPFLSDEMIDVGRLSFPCMADMDLDGDFDLVIGSEGRYIPSIHEGQPGFYQSAVYLFENTGSKEFPQFTLRNTDLGGLSAFKQPYLAPAVADLNGDGLPDLLVGKSGGGFYYLPRLAPAETYAFQADSSQWAGLATGSAPTPFLADLDQDGDFDLLAGNRKGLIQLYTNTGSVSNPVFSNQPTVEDFGKVETVDEQRSNYGYSCPVFFRFQQQSYLLSGSESGRVYLWEVSESPFDEPFALLDSNLLNQLSGKRSTPALADLNRDGFPDLIAGGYRGGVNMFMGSRPESIQEVIESKFRIWPNPAQNRINWDSKHIQENAELRIFDVSGKCLAVQKTDSKMDSLDISFLNPGIYILSLRNAQGVFHASFIKGD